MKPLSATLGTMFVAALCLISSGCERFPGKPGPGPDVPRPETIVDFPTLYKTNCAACHGNNGVGGAAIALNNPAYLAFTSESNINGIITNGVHDHLMPSFGKATGGMLTDEQVTAFAHGIMSWSNPAAIKSATPPPYNTALTGDAARGQQAYAASCSRCHGAAGQGVPANPNTGEGRIGSIVDPSYLALVSDHYLRSLIVAGRPDFGMPDWRSDAQQPLSDQQVTDIVAWLASNRTANPGQPYPTH